MKDYFHPVTASFPIAFNSFNFFNFFNSHNMQKLQFISSFFIISFPSME